MSRKDGRSSREEELLAIIRRLEARIAELEAEVARLRKNSSTSSKPPSSDIVKPPKPPKPKGAKKRRKGAQPGHPRHERPAFSPDEVDEIREYRLDACPNCGSSVEPCAAPPRILQQAEFPAKLITVCEHRAMAFRCSRCDTLHYAPLPAYTRNGGLAGPGLTAFVGYLKGACHCSYGTVQKLLQDALAFSVSTGYLVKLVQKASAALNEPYEELLARLPHESVLNIDETGHKENGQRMWTWCFRAQDFTVFRIESSRGSEVLFQTLGADFDGLLGCDYYSAYRKFMGQSDAILQFCLAHFIRDVRFLTESRDTVTANYGHRVLDGLRRLFRVIHRRDQMVPAQFQRRLEKERDRLLKTAKRAPPRTEAQNLAQRFRAHGKQYFTFITTPGIEPTNNLAEQAIRFCVLDRRVTQGTRAQNGRQWCERIWTLAATCAQRGHSLYAFLHDALDAHLDEQPAPSC
jgi:transposase